MDFLKHLNSQKILVLFLIALAIGCLAIYFDNLTIPVAVILIYGGILWFAQWQYKVFLTLTDKNSPYFMGFLFTLIALFNLFAKSTEAITTKILFTNLSIALITTIVGLVIRQIIHGSTTVPGSELESMRTLREHLQESLEDYNEAQSRILNLLEDYSINKNEILKNEKRISDKYLKALERATDIFAQLDQDFSGRIQSFLKTFQDYTLEFQATVEELIPENFSQEIAQRFKGFHEGYIEKLESGIGNFQSSMQRISSEIITRAEDDYVNSLKTSSETITSTLGDYSTSVGLLTIEMEENSNKIKDRFSEILANLSDYSDKTESIKQNLAQTSGAFQTQIEVFDEAYQKRLSQFKSELESINGLIESFIEAVNKKLSAL